MEAERSWGLAGGGNRWRAKVVAGDKEGDDFELGLVPSTFSQLMKRPLCFAVGILPLRQSRVILVAATEPPNHGWDAKGGH